MSNEKFKPTGKQIKKALIDLDLSYRELAHGVGCSIYYIREIAAETRKAPKMRGKIASFINHQYEKQGSKERVA